MIIQTHVPLIRASFSYVEILHKSYIEFEITLNTITF